MRKEDRRRKEEPGHSGLRNCRSKGWRRAKEGECGQSSRQQRKRRPRKPLGKPRAQVIGREQERYFGKALGPGRLSFPFLGPVGIYALYQCSRTFLMNDAPHPHTSFRRVSQLAIPVTSNSLQPGFCPALIPSFEVLMFCLKHEL